MSLTRRKVYRYELLWNDACLRQVDWEVKREIMESSPYARKAGDLSVSRARHRLRECMNRFSPEDADELDQSIASAVKWLRKRGLQLCACNVHRVLLALFVIFLKYHQFTCTSPVEAYILLMGECFSHQLGGPHKHRKRAMAKVEVQMMRDLGLVGSGTAALCDAFRLRPSRRV